MPRRHAGPDAGDAGAHTRTVAGADLFSHDAGAFIDADDAIADHAVADVEPHDVVAGPLAATDAAI